METRTRGCRNYVPWTPRIHVLAAKVRWPELSQLSLCSAFDKENSIESPLDFATLYIQLLLWLCTLSPTVLMPVSWLLCHMLWLCCDHSVTLVTPLWLCDYHVIFPILHLSNNLKKRKEKEKKYKYWLSRFAKSWQTPLISDLCKSNQSRPPGDSSIKL